MYPSWYEEASKKVRIESPLDLTIYNLLSFGIQNTSSLCVVLGLVYLDLTHSKIPEQL